MRQFILSYLYILHIYKDTNKEKKKTLYLSVWVFSTTVLIAAGGWPDGYL